MREMTHKPSPIGGSPAPCVPTGSSEPSSVALVGLDQKMIGQIQFLERNGNPRLLSRLTTLFVEQSARYLAQIRGSALTGDSASMQLASHSLKSNSANIGAHRLSRLCLAIEDQARIGDTRIDDELWRAIENEYAAVLLAIRNLHA